MCLGFIGCWFITATQDNNCPLCDTYLSTSHRTTSKARRSLSECKWPASTSASSRNSSSDATAHSAGHDLGPRPAAADSGLNRPLLRHTIESTIPHRPISLTFAQAVRKLHASEAWCLFPNWVSNFEAEDWRRPGTWIDVLSVPGPRRWHGERYRKLLNLSTALGACGCNGRTLRRKFNYADKSWSFYSVNLLVLFCLQPF